MITNTLKKCHKHVQHMHEYSLEIFEVFMNNAWISVDDAWIIQMYLQIIHGKFGKPSVCFSQETSGVLRASN